MSLDDRLRDYLDLQQRKLKPNTFQAFQDGLNAFRKYCELFDLAMLL
jgi:hypothetical protein